MILSIDDAFKIAIQEALQGAPFVSPNPKVGCVILNRHGEMISKGFHKKFGQAHAEIEALEGLTLSQLQGAHVIVTLEPCAHEGKTPSCAKKLATLPIAKVTYGLADPNPLVAGQGAAILKAAGIEAVEYQGPLKLKLEETCEEFLWNFRKKEIFVAFKVAQSLDGKIALLNGESQWITGPESREKVHRLRAQYDAVLVGKGTVLKDNPSLNIRLPDLKKENKVILLDRNGELLKKADQLKVFQLHQPENIFVCVKPDFQGSSDRAQIVKAADLKQTLKELYQFGIRSLMVEGGSQVYSSFLKHHLVQRLHIFTAPILLGQGLSWNDSLSLQNMSEKIRLKNPALEIFADDTYRTGRIDDFDF